MEAGDLEETPFQVISLRGDAYTRGVQHGSQAKELIKRNISYYLHLWETYSGMDRMLVLEQARGFIPMIEMYDREIMEEIRGIADGAGISVEEAVALNSRYEFVWAKMAVEHVGRGECTSIAAAPEACPSNHTLIGQNWDYKPRLSGGCVVLEIEQPERPNIVTHVEAGTVAKMGLNSAGIGLCINALISDRDRFTPKVPILVVCRGILNAGSLSDSIRAVISAERSVSANFLIAHEEGEIIDLEATPEEVGFIYPESGIMTHSNHFIELRKNVVDMAINICPDTLIRAERAKRLISRNLGKIDVEKFKEILRDHFNWPNSICRHEDPRFHQDLQLKTLTSMIMDLNEKTIYISNGPPCENKYSKLVFKKLKND
jgi:isopenicillin-N N-acyltransferase-like protein